MQSKIQILLALICLILCAYLSVTLPISEEGIPFTAQSLGVFVVASLLRPRDFFITISVYLLLGILGLPVFAEGSHGWSKIAGSSGGFLYGFIFSGLLISYLVHQVGSVDYGRVIGAMLLGTLVLFGCGLAHLSFKFGWIKALEYGLYPFWKMALVKAGMAAFLVIIIESKLKKRH